MTKLAVASGVPALPALALGILTCVGFGIVNGGLVTLVGLPAFIVTLGTLNIAFALTHIVSNDNTYPGLPSSMLFFGRTFRIAGGDFTYGTVLMLALYAFAWYALRQTAWGRHVYAVGDNREAARLTGIKTGRVLFSVYAIAGLTYGVAAMLLAARTELGDPNAGQTTENLDSITAVVLGGTSLFGGRGSILRTLFGVLFIVVLQNGLDLIGVGDDLKRVVIGSVLIVGASTDFIRSRVRLRRRTARAALR
jgi:fructose transport system permease protein